LEFTYGNDGTAPLIALSSGGDINMANGTTLRFNASANLPAGVIGPQLQAANTGLPAYPYGWTVANHINIASGTSTANIRVGGNENSVRFTGNVTGGTSDSQTLAIFAGGIATGNGDRQPNVFSGTIANGSGGTLGVNVDFAGASGPAQNVFVSLSGQNTFTGPIVVTNSKGLTGAGAGGGYLGIGGEIHSGGPTFVPGTGYLGGGNYSNTIALAAGTKLTYLSSADQILGGEISGGGALLKQGAGTLTLAVANTYTGTTTVSAGTLRVNNTTASGTGAGNVTVTAGTLAGTGSISGTVTIGNGSGSADAILAPGNSDIDSIDTGNLSFLSDGSYAVELNGTSVTTDVTNVTGTVAINAATTLTVDVAGTLSPSQQYTIISNDGADAVTGTFFNLIQDAVVGTFGGTDLKISYTGGDGNDIVLYTAGSGTPYGTWATGSEPFDGDANGDGVDDGLAWFLGAATPSTNALDKLPLVATPTGFLTLDFDRVTPSSPAKLYVEYGNDLVGWTKVLIPATSGKVFTVDTRPFARTTEESPTNDTTHWKNNGESMFLIGKGMGDGMVDLLNFHTLVTFNHL
jgi:autotransporter-associated beta strand protein